MPKQTAASQRSDPRSTPGGPTPAQPQSTSPAQAVAPPQGVALPEVAVHEDVGLGRRQPGHPLLGLRQQGPGLPAAQGGEVDAGDWPVASGQRRAGGQGDGVQPGRGAAE
jgi:hypothetical protein